MEETSAESSEDEVVAPSQVTARERAGCPRGWAVCLDQLDMTRCPSGQTSGPLLLPWARSSLQRHQATGHDDAHL